MNIIKTVCFVVFILTKLSVSGQETNKLAWETGEEKDIKLSVTATEIEQGEIKLDTNYVTQSKIIVKQQNDSSLVLVYSMGNRFMDLGSKYYKKIKNDKLIDNYFDLQLMVDKFLLSSELLNKDEYQSVLKENHKKVVTSLTLNAPESLPESINQMNKLLSEMLKDTDLDVFELILSTYKIEYSFGDSIVKRDSSLNPFNLKNFNGAEITTYATEPDRKKRFTIKVETGYNFEEYKKTLHKVMSNFNSSIKSVDNSDEVNSKIDEMYSRMLSEIDFDASQSTEINCNLDSGCPSKISRKTILGVNSPDKQAKIIIDLNIDIN